MIGILIKINDLPRELKKEGHGDAEERKKLLRVRKKRKYRLLEMCQTK